MVAHVLQVSFLFLSAPLELLYFLVTLAHEGVETGSQAGVVGLVMAVECSLLLVQIHF